ncbi:hypothetical protein DFH09DRAFT_1466702 [Mycena vulgaris]|nr:hypothetical protein DFH09DRAFT_1466702 [Mycena vulgaris]
MTCGWQVVTIAQATIDDAVHSKVRVFAVEETAGKAFNEKPLRLEVGEFEAQCTIGGPPEPNSASRSQSTCGSSRRRRKRDSVVLRVTAGRPKLLVIDGNPYLISEPVADNIKHCPSISASGHRQSAAAVRRLDPCIDTAMERCTGQNWLTRPRASKVLFGLMRTDPGHTSESHIPSTSTFTFKFPARPTHLAVLHAPRLNLNRFMYKIGEIVRSFWTAGVARWSFDRPTNASDLRLDIMTEDHSKVKSALVWRSQRLLRIFSDSNKARAILASVSVYRSSAFVVTPPASRPSEKLGSSARNTSLQRNWNSAYGGPTHHTGDVVRVIPLTLPSEKRRTRICIAADLECAPDAKSVQPRGFTRRWRCMPSRHGGNDDIISPSESFRGLLNTLLSPIFTEFWQTLAKTQATHTRPAKLCACLCLRTQRAEVAVLAVIPGAVVLLASCVLPLHPLLRTLRRPRLPTRSPCSGATSEPPASPPPPVPIANHAPQVRLDLCCPTKPHPSTSTHALVSTADPSSMALHSCRPSEWCCEVSASRRPSSPPHAPRARGSDCTTSPPHRRPPCQSPIHKYALGAAFKLQGSSSTLRQTEQEDGQQAPFTIVNAPPPPPPPLALTITRRGAVSIFARTLRATAAPPPTRPPCSARSVLAGIRVSVCICVCRVCVPVFCAAWRQRARVCERVVRLEREWLVRERGASPTHPRNRDAPLAPPARIAILRACGLSRSGCGPRRCRTRTRQRPSFPRRVNRMARNNAARPANIPSACRTSSLLYEALRYWLWSDGMYAVCGFCGTAGGALLVSGIDPGMEARALKRTYETRCKGMAVGGGGDREPEASKSPLPASQAIYAPEFDHGAGNKVDRRIPNIPATFRPSHFGHSFLLLSFRVSHLRAEPNAAPDDRIKVA